MITNPNTKTLMIQINKNPYKIAKKIYIHNIK
jgi:hypothetical protein